MKKTISVVALASLFAAGSAMASGYRIPEQSLDSTAKAGANIASADSVDAAYYNPAAMSRLPDTWQVEATATYLHLTAKDYEDYRSPAYSGESEQENFLLPTFFVVSPDYNNVRFGFSVTAPYGLAQRWSDPYPRTFAEKFSLKVFDINPTVSYKFNDMISIAGGVRLLYNEATVMSNGTGIGQPVGRYVKGDTTEWGYNLALDVKPTEDLTFAVTYRSNVELDFEGDVLLTYMGMPVVDTGGEVTVQAPAVLAFSAAYTYDKWKFDLTVDQTYWSEYEELDFNYDVPLPPSLAFFDRPIPKNWDDTFAVRLGIEYKWNPKLTLMGGIAWDENPIPEESLGFELADSDAWLYSVGARYAFNEKLEAGVSLLYDYKEDREVKNDTINGEFTNATAFLVSCGLTYRF